jgi:hypothetical protein
MEAFNQEDKGSVRMHPLTTGRTFGPRALTTIGAAFDDAWQAVESCFIGPLSHQAARLVLANTILEHATDDSRDPGLLTWIGISELARRGYLGAAETPNQKALSAILESQNLISLSRAELKTSEQAFAVRESITAEPQLSCRPPNVKLLKTLVAASYPTPYGNPTN